MLRVCIYGIIIILLVVGCGVYYAANASWIPEKLIPVFVNAAVQDLTVTSFSLKKQSIGLDSTLVWKEIESTYAVQGETASVSAETLMITPLSTVLPVHDTPQPLHVFLENARITTPEIWVRDLNTSTDFLFKNGIAQSVASVVSLESLMVQNISAHNIRIETAGAFNRLITSTIHATLYDGTANVRLIIEPTHQGKFYAHAEYANINITHLGQDRPDLFAQVDGIASGTLNASGTNEGIDALTAQMTIEKEGSINAALLQPLLTYIPQSTQRKEIEQLIRERKKIDLDKTTLTIHNTDTETLATTIMIQSIRYNLNINLTIDVRIEGGLLNALKLTQKNIQHNT